MKQLLAVLVVMLVVESCPAGTWIPVVIHLHTIFSDGGGTPEQVAAAVIAALTKAGYNGKCVIIVCDHFDGVARSFEKYADAIRAASTGKVIMIPGLELGSKWRPEPNTVAVSHMLAIGHLPPDYKTLLSCYDLNTSGSGLPLLDRFDMQQQLIDKVLSLGMLPVAAHPTQMLSGINIARSDNRFNTQQGYAGLCGVEQMNTLGPGQDDECVKWYLTLVRLGLLVFVTAGSDYHGTVASTIPDALIGSLNRVTWVYADDFSAESIIRAISEGKTYAGNAGSCFGNILADGGQNPGFEVVGVDDPTIVAQPWVIGRDINTIIYRNGSEVTRQQYKGNESTLCCYPLNGGDDFKTGWTDTQVQPGSVNRYVIRVVATTKLGKQTQLITSPITLRLRLPGETAAFFDAIKAKNLAGVEEALAADPSLANARDLRDNYNFQVHTSKPLALSVACRMGTTEMVRCLLEHGAQPDSYLGAGEPGPLMECAYTGDTEKARLILNHGGNPSICSDGNTPLAWALGGMKVELAKFLLEQGADPNSRNDNGTYALAIARRLGLTEIVQILEAKGAKE